MVIVGLVIDILLIIGFVTAGFLTERAINRRADAAITRLDDNADDRISIWARSLALGNPRLLAVILSCPTWLCLSFVEVLVLLILPFPLPVESNVSYLLFLLFSNLLWWLPNVPGKAKEIRRKVVKSTQTTDVQGILGFEPEEERSDSKSASSSMN